MPGTDLQVADMAMCDDVWIERARTFIMGRLPGTSVSRPEQTPETTDRFAEKSEAPHAHAPFPRTKHWRASRQLNDRRLSFRSLGKLLGSLPEPIDPVGCHL